ncbi:MAG TPA: amidohydrolase family protein [Trebonia sp.]|jgi:aminocarboxymuconate-semialdehyde decarboxylase|nr:amidohydrolase family protein [Trebonia sp.]
MTSPSQAVACTDVHAHAVPQALLDMLVQGEARFPHVAVRAAKEGSPAGGLSVVFGDRPPTRPVAPGLTDVGRRREWMAANGVTCQVIGGWLDMFGYDLPAAEGRDWAELFTAQLTDLAAAEPGLVPLGTVALQDPDSAADALAAQRESGLRGVMISTRPGGFELDDPRLRPFFEAADDTGAVVYLHPGFGSASARYHDYGLVNGLARLEDTTVALARALYDGIPERYPRMRMVVAHGGGSLPMVLGRLRRNHAINPATTKDPMASFAALYFDSVVFDPLALEFLLRQAEPGHVMLGSDYPFPIGDLNPAAVVQRAQSGDGERGRVLTGTAESVFGLAPAGVR